MRHEHRAARVDVLTRALDDARLPALVGRVGATTVEQWVEGTALPDRSARREHVTAAADILGTLHRFTGIGRERLPRQRALGDVGRRTTERLEQLADRGLLSAREAARLSRIASDLPGRGAWGVIHTDFGGDNLVAGAAGGVVSIDNEHLVRGFLDFDVARSWYRWPLPHASWSAFVRAYENRAGREVPASELRAWIVVAASLGVHRRLVLGVDHVAALRRLRATLDG
jgi:Ser/Thr protein kinase RdoA (MazF antagonist)